MKKNSIPLNYLVTAMKVTLVPFLVSLLFTGLSFAKDGLAQELLKRPISIQADQEELKSVLSSIEKTTKVRFSYIPSLVQKQKVSITATNQRLDAVLEKLLIPLQIKYTVSGNYIILNKKTAAAPVRDDNLETLVPLPYLHSREINLKGTIASADTKEPLPGVSIVLKGTSQGTTADAGGNFEITAPSAESILVFSFVGYESQEIIVGNRSSLQVLLKSDVKALSEVIVVGYGTQKRSDLTGSVSSVKAEDVKNLPVRSVTEALQGRAAGVQVTRNDGSPGASSDIVIRGVGSIGGMSPLYIVDGIRMSAGSNFNMQDVESIEILKDASAAAIYGAQAAGGVVLVTTKRGKTLDKMTINFNAYYGVRKPLNLYSMLNTADYIKAKSAFGVATSSWGDPNTLPDNDWVKDLYTNGKEQSYSLSMSGATAKTNYYLSANYQREGGTMIDNYFERYGLRSNTDFKISRKLKVGETLYAWATKTNPMVSNTFPFRSAPVVGIYDETNTYGGWAKTGTFFTGPNLVGQEYQNHMQNATYALEGNLYADLEIIKGLNLRSTVGLSYYNDNNYRYNEAYDYGTVSNHTAFLSKDNNSTKNLTANFVLTYVKNFGKHELKALAGYEAYQSDLSSLHAEARGFPYVTYNLGLTNNPSSYVAGGGDLPQTRLLSQFGRINYSYSDKYLFTATVRRDGSDRFGPTNKFGVFPSASVGWKMNEEAFIRDNLSYVSNLKVRASYGKLGSTSNIPQYTYQASYGGSGGTNAQGLPDGSRSKGYSLTAQLANQNIKWESVLQTDIGLDVGFLKNALNLTVDWYSRQTQDMIYQVPVPSSAGFNTTSVFTNIGKMSNKGLEIAADYRGKKGSFTYGITANASFNRNLVKKLDGTNNNPINDGSAGDYLESVVARTQAGMPMSQFYGYKVEGIFKTDAEVQALNEKAQQSAGGATGVFYQAAATGAGDLHFKDVNGDGKITTDDKTFIGNPWPKMTYGFTLNAGWKGFEITALFQGVQGVDVFNGNKYYTQFFVGDYNTTKDIFKTSFFNGNGLTSEPRIGYKAPDGTYVRDPNSNYTRISSFAIENGSFLKLRNLQIGYNIPKSALQALHVSDLKIYLQGQNLLTFTKYSGLDPEVLGRNGTTGRGIDAIYSYPRTALYSLGINLTF